MHVYEAIKTSLLEYLKLTRCHECRKGKCCEKMKLKCRNKASRSTRALKTRKRPAKAKGLTRIGMKHFFFVRNRENQAMQQSCRKSVYRSFQKVRETRY